METVPEVYMGKNKVYQETFKSPHEYPNRKDALNKLNAVRDAHPRANGWVEISYDIYKTESGFWRVEVTHAKYE